MKVAVVHDWLTSMRGGEKCLEIFCELFPDADLYTLLHIPGACSDKIERMKIHTSFIQRLPFAAKRYRNYLPLFPGAIERFNFRSYELIISSSHCVAKGIIPPPDSLHICYIHTPMRYIWDMFDDYFFKDRVGAVKRNLISQIATWLRTWDAASSSRVDHFIANSRHTQKRVWKYYRREAQVIYPPVDTSFFQPGGEKQDYYLMVSALVPYKRFDLAIDAFNQLKRPLVIIGGGPEEKRLRGLARFSGIKFLGRQDDETLRKHYQGCRALVFPGEEDFGIVPVEAMACGRPVIAYARGGLLETVIPFNASSHPTGIFFGEQNPKSLSDAVMNFEKREDEFKPEAIRAQAEKFDRGIFKEKISELVERLVPAAGEGK